MPNEWKVQINKNRLQKYPLWYFHHRQEELFFKDFTVAVFKRTTNAL